MTASRPPDTAAELACRKLLSVSPAPATPLAALTTLSTLLHVGTTLTVSYVPDRLLLARDAFAAYAAARGAQADTTPEALAAVIADDLANELVPKWLRVSVSAAGAVSHTACVEDRQPGWDQPSLFKSV